MKLLSVIVLTYKQFNYVFDTLKSILAQDYPRIELIIADDGSSNFPRKEIEDYIETIKRDNLENSKVLANNVNRGTVKNTNNGIINSNGDYLKIIAGDDVIYDTTVCRKQIDVLEKTGGLIVTGKTQECDAELKPMFKLQTEKTNEILTSIFRLAPKEYLDKCSRDGLFPLVTQAMCFRRTFFDKYGLYDERYRLLEDPPMALRIIINQVPVETIDSYVVKHRANVGISENNELFSEKKSQYYLDLANYYKQECIAKPDLFPSFRTRQRYREEAFRYKMSVAKTSAEKALLVIKNIDTAIFFVVLRPKRAMEKIKILLKNKRKLLA